MFTLPTETGERIRQALAQRVCTAADGSYIRFSGGRSKAGRPSKYSVHMADGTFFTVRAANDNEAVELANKKIKKISKEWFPTKAPAYCKTWYDLTEKWVSGLPGSHEAYQEREQHVTTCEQCQAAKKSEGLK